MVISKIMDTNLIYIYIYWLGEHHNNLEHWHYVFSKLTGTLVHPECTRKKVIQFDGRPDKVKGMDHVHVAMVFFAIVIVSMKIDITILSFHV